MAERRMSSQILQLTDLHLMADPDALLKGVRTRDSLMAVVSLVNERCASGEWEPQYIVLTGDLTHDERLATYRQLRELLGEWLARCLVIPGNHDVPSLMREAFPDLVLDDAEFITFSVEAAGWRLIGLDSYLPGDLGGQVGSKQLQWLADELSAHASQPTILFVHHPPVPVQSAHLDCIGLRDADALLEIVAAHPQLRIISAGHVHQEFFIDLDGLHVMTTPSTSVQFLPRQDELICDSIPPGLRIFHLDGGLCRTEVVRVARET